MRGESSANKRTSAVAMPPLLLALLGLLVDDGAGGCAPSACSLCSASEAKCVDVFGS